MEHSFSMVILIVIAIVVVSFIAFNKPDVVERLCFDAEKVRRRQYYRLVSHVLVHGGWMHLIFNVMTLYFFGPLAERLFEIFFPGNGGLVFLVYFAGASVVSSLPSMRHRSYSAIGASGAIAAVMFTGILIRPQMEIMMFPLPIGIPAYLFGGLYLAFSYYMSRNSNDNIGHEAHFWGAVYGFVLPILYDARFLSEFIANIKG